MEQAFISWIPIKTETIPPVGLINYGYAVTSSGVMVLYGGQIESTPECHFQKRTLLTSSDLWIVNMTVPVLDFMLVEWMSSEMGGYSKIISLDGDLLVVINRNFENGMKLLDINRMESYAIKSKNVPDNFFRTSFGIAGNGTHFMLYGGYDQINGISQPAVSDLIYQISFSVTDVTATNENLIQLESSTVISIVCGIVVIVVIGLILRQHLKKQYARQKKLLMDLKEKRMEESAIALENSRKEFEERVKNLANDPTFTATLAVAGDVGLYIPGFREYKFNIDFRATQSLAKGGMGEVFLGKLLNNQTIKLNDENPECIIKKPLSDMENSLFLQEVAIHEVFRQNKYFAQLICFSLGPQSIVLKYYPLGSLKNLIYKKDPQLYADIKYNVNFGLYLLKKITWALQLMHSKGYVHNDIKPDNILLDSDKEEKIFPVISDFGVVFILNSANVVKGYAVKMIKGATLIYASPEIIRSLMKKSQDFSPTLKSDVYSIGILSFEILGRKKPWENFDKNKVVAGQRPRIEGLNVPENTKKMIVKCWSNDPTARPTMEEVYIDYCNTLE
jgi:hypothetical protein